MTTVHDSSLLPEGTVVRDRRWDLAEVQAAGPGTLTLAYTGKIARVPLTDLRKARLLPLEVIQWGSITNPTTLDLLTPGARVSVNQVTWVRLANGKWRIEADRAGERVASADLVSTITPAYVLDGRPVTREPAVLPDELDELAHWLLDDLLDPTQVAVELRNIAASLREPASVPLVPASTAGVTRDAAYRALLGAHLASARVMMDDGYPSTFMRGNEDAAEQAVEVLEQILTDPEV